MHPTAVKADPARLGLFDLPTELRIHIFELYCLSFSEGSDAELEPIWDMQGSRGIYHMQGSRGIYHIRPRSGGLHHAALLKPQLVCRQLRHEFMDAWATCTTFDLPQQWIDWPWSRPREEPEVLARDETIRQLYFVIRDWLEGVPNNMRHRLRRLRLAFATPQCSWGTGLRSAECLLNIKGALVARLMERLEVHHQLRLEVEIGVEKYCCANHHWPYKDWMRFKLKQRSPEEVREEGGDEWACVEEQRRMTEPRWKAKTRFCHERALREGLVAIL